MTKMSSSSASKRAAEAYPAANTPRQFRPETVGILHGAKTYLLQDTEGQVSETECVSAGLDYPAVGPEHCLLKDTGRAEYVAAEDEEVLDAFELLCKTEGILPALESTHALAYLVSQKGKLPANTIAVVNLSGRGDKDVGIVEKYRPVI